MATDPAGDSGQHARRRSRPAAVALTYSLCGLLLGVAVWLQWQAIDRQSFSGDAVYHLVAGHQAWRYGHDTLNLEHPPLAKLVMAWPAIWEEEPLAPRLRVEAALAALDTVHEEPERLFRIGRRGRWLSFVCFGAPLWVAAFFLGRRFGGEAAGLALAAMLALSFPMVGNLSILQTDTAITLAFVLTLLAAHRLQRTGSAPACALTGLALGLALSVKYSGLLLAPAVFVALWGVAAEPRNWRRFAARLLLVAALALATVEASYALANLRPDPEAVSETIRAYCRGRGTLIVGHHMLRFEAPLLGLAAVDPRLAAWLTGLIGIAIQNAIGVYPSYALGEVSYEGRWWYFPALLAVKLPLLLLALLLWRAVAAARRWSRRGPPAGFSAYLLAALTGALYLAAAMASNYNLGVRHMMPLLPILLLPAAVSVGRRWWPALVLAGLLAVESILLTPLWMCATNTWWLGSGNPSRFAFGTGNTEYRQNFFELAREAEKRRIEELRVLYPSLGEPVLRAYLPDARLVSRDEPVVPGWYAVNVRVEQYVPAAMRLGEGPLYDLAERWRPSWEAIREGADHGYVAGTFHLYHLEGE